MADTESERKETHMKSIDELNFPDELAYSRDHLWARINGDRVRIGITDYAQDQLGDIVYVELPEPEDHFDADEEFGSIESVKTVSQLHSPLAGTVSAINPLLEDEPATIASSPYDAGWLIEITPDDGVEAVESMISKASYLQMLSD